jgi:hypothetical protein
MTLEQRPLHQLVPYCVHPRTNNCASDRRAASLQEFGRDAVLEVSGEAFGQTPAARRLSIPEVR